MDRYEPLSEDAEIILDLLFLLLILQDLTIHLLALLFQILDTWKYIAAPLNSRIASTISQYPPASQEAATEEH